MIRLLSSTKKPSRHQRLTMSWVVLGALALLPLYGHAQQAYNGVGSGGSPSFVLSGTVQRAVQATQPEQGFVGLDMAIRGNRYPTVNSVFKGSPAHNQGMMPGDEIIAINGMSTLGRSIYQIDEMISDVPGTPVRLTLNRYNSLQEVELIVAPVSQVSTTASRWLD